MSRGEVVKVIWRSDQKRMVEIVRRGGFYSFEESGEQFDLNEAYWGPFSGGGLHDTPEGAENTARAEVPWLRDQAAS
jgi:hypothetical protein